MIIVTYISLEPLRTSDLTRHGGEVGREVIISVNICDIENTKTLPIHTFVHYARQALFHIYLFSLFIKSTLVSADDKREIIRLALIVFIYTPFCAL